MTIPDKLVTPAAQALCYAKDEYGDPCFACKQKARNALAAAFAALPECEEVHHVVVQNRLGGSQAVLDAIARMAES